MRHRGLGLEGAAMGRTTSTEAAPLPGADDVVYNYASLPSEREITRGYGQGVSSASG
jgi:hypothetical protein